MATTILTTENLTEARNAVTTYRSTCESIFSKLQADINSLTGADFIGDASKGYVDFFSQVTPALTTNLTGTEQSVTSMLESLLTLVEQMLNPVDPELGNANKTAASEGGNENG